MIVELVRCSDRTFELKEGSRCPILHSLETAGLVTEQKKAEGAFFNEKIYAVICSCV